MENRISRIQEIYVRHRRPTIRFKGSYGARKNPYINAKMTLWAVTDLGDHVWLETREALDTRRIEIKVHEYEEANKGKVGMTIEYTQNGFIRGYRGDPIKT